MNRFIQTLMRDEGFEEKVYLDHLGFPTIGYGTRISEIRVSEAVARRWLEEEVAEKEARLEKIDTYDFLNGARKDVIRSMAYQMGVQGTKNFKDMWAAIGMFNWQGAADAMRDSRWWRDPETRGRAERMAVRMERGVW